MLVFSFISILGIAFYQLLKPIENKPLNSPIYKKEKILEFRENGVKSHA